MQPFMRLIASGLLLLFAHPATAPAQVAPDPVISLHPGDVVKLEVWREEDLSGEFLIAESGLVTLPILGPIRVTGIPIAELRDSLLQAYSKELRNPSIDIIPLRRVFVLGEVNEPGLYEVDPTLSLAGAVAMAGGANMEGNLRKIRVVREGKVILDGVATESPLALATLRSGDQIYVARRSWFDRNSTFIVSALLSVTSIVISLLR